MIGELTVLIDVRVAGRLQRDRAGRLTFAYDEEYRADAEATPLSVSMPLAIGTHGHAVVSPWLAGLLPDDPAVVAAWARRFDVSGSSPFAVLSTPVGRDCAGAVRFVPSDDVPSALARGGRVRWLTDDEVAARLRMLRTDASAWLGPDFSGRFSLAGMQAKTALVRNGRRWGLPSGSAATSHILKPAIKGFDEHDVNEHLCLRAASHTGLIAASTEVCRFGDETVLVVERFDRRRRGRWLDRIHQEDLCQALALDPSRRYQADGGPGPAGIASLLRRVMPGVVGDEAVARFADALVFNWLIAGTDAHAKNYALLLAGRQVRLAPLYDVASALPYGTHERKLRLAMKLGDRAYALDGQRASTWANLARQLALDADRLVERAIELASIVPDGFADARRGLGDIGGTLGDRLLDGVAARAARCSEDLRRRG